MNDDQRFNAFAAGAIHAHGALVIVFAFLSFIQGSITAIRGNSQAANAVWGAGCALAFSIIRAVALFSGFLDVVSAIGSYLQRAVSINLAFVIPWAYNSFANAIRAFCMRFCCCYPFYAFAAGTDRSGRAF